MSSVNIEFAGQTDYSDIAGEALELVGKRLPRRIAREVVPPVERYLDRLIQQRLTKQPPRRTANSPRFVWSFDARKQARARRWFFANYPNGYRRTGRMARSWVGIVNYRSGAFEIGIRNPSEGASFVYGSPRHNYAQVPGHAATGWLNAGKEGQDVVLDAVIELDRRLIAVIDTEIERL